MSSYIHTYIHNKDISLCTPERSRTGVYDFELILRRKRILYNYCVFIKMLFLTVDTKSVLLSVSRNK